MQNIKVFTNSTFNDTIKIEKYLEPVTFHVVLGMNFFADFLQSFTDVFGGKSDSYQKRLESINKEVIEGIKKKVQKVGGNAAIDLRIDNDEISAKSKSMIMVTAIATAVIITENQKAIQNDLQKKLSQGIDDGIDFEEFNFQTKLIDLINKLIEIQSPREFMSVLDTSIDESLAPLLKEEIFDVFARLDINPSFSFTGIVKENINKSFGNLDYIERSAFLYSQFYKIIKHENRFVEKKLEYLCLLIIQSNSMNYELSNELLIQENSELKEIGTSLYSKHISNKPSFYKSDITHLENGKNIFLANGNEDAVEVINVMVDKLNFIFHKT